MTWLWVSLGLMLTGLIGAMSSTKAEEMTSFKISLGLFVVGYIVFWAYFATIA